MPFRCSVADVWFYTLAADTAASSSVFPLKDRAPTGRRMRSCARFIPDPIELGALVRIGLRIARQRCAGDLVPAADDCG